MNLNTAAHVPDALQLRPLQQMQARGFDLAVLLAMEKDALMAAHRCMSLAGQAITRESLIETAGRDLPRDARLLQAYTETASALASRPVRELEQLADMLQHCAKGLEAAAVKHTAATGVPFAEQARTHHAIGERLADLLQGAHTLQNSGVISVQSNARRLESLATAVQNGPLGKFLDKARALLNERLGAGEAMVDRMAPSAA